MDPFSWLGCDTNLETFLTFLTALVAFMPSRKIVEGQSEPVASGKDLTNFLI